MELEKLEARTMCDNGACGKIAEYSVAREGTPLNLRLHLCSGCIRELYELFDSHLHSEKEKKQCGIN